MEENNNFEIVLADGKKIKGTINGNWSYVKI